MPMHQTIKLPPKHEFQSPTEHHPEKDKIPENGHPVI